MVKTNTSDMGDADQATGSVYESFWCNAAEIPAIALGLFFRGREMVDFPDWFPRQTFTLKLSTQRIVSGPNLELIAPGLMPGCADLNWVSMEATGIDGPCRVLISCFEIFRVYYAYNSKFVHALLSGPWPYARDRIIDVARSDVTTDAENWTVSMRDGIGLDSARHAALLGLSDFGFKSAMVIFPSVAHDKHLKAEIPSSMDTLRVTADFVSIPCYARDMPALILLRITEADSPLPFIPKITGVRDISSRKAIRSSAGLGTASYRGTVTMIDELPSAVTDNKAKPVKDGFALQSGGIQVKWDGGPRLVKTSRDQPGESSNGRRQRLTTTESSTRSPYGEYGDGIGENITQSGGSGTHADDSLLPRMNDVLNVIKALAIEKKLSYEVINCPAQVIVRENLSLWPFTTTLVTKKVGRDEPEQVNRVSWGWLNAQWDVPRGALVLRILLNAHDIPVYWLEIEGDPSEDARRFQSLVFQTVAGDEKAIVDVLDQMFLLWATVPPVEPKNDSNKVFGDYAVGRYWRHSSIDTQSIFDVLKVVSEM